MEKQYTECFVAFIDILGFKNIINRETCDYIAHIFDAIRGTTDLFHDYNFTSINSESMKKLKIKVMSDSICVFVEKEVKDAFATLLIACASFQAELLHCMPKPIMLRGAIVSGDIADQGETVYGPALTMAYLMEQNNAKVPRIIITKELLDDVSSCNSGDSTTCRLIQNMTFCDSDAFYVLDCFKFLAVLDYKSGGEDLKRVKSYTEEMLNRTIDESIRQKYLYVQKMLSRCCS